MEATKYSCHKKLDTRRRHPVIIYMHGCSGSPQKMASFSNFAVTVAPDSFARPGRILDCRKKTDKKEIMRLRFAEVEYAYNQLLNLAWVDKSKIFLVGFSEGGATAALYSGKEHFAGRIILGWVCASLDDWWVGINGPAVPTLAVVGDEDPWYQHEGQFGKDCGEHLTYRVNSKSLVIHGQGHDIVNDDETVEALEWFFKTVNVP
jgi:dienelactone hydrolase